MNKIPRHILYFSLLLFTQFGCAHFNLSNFIPEDWDSQKKNPVQKKGKSEDFTLDKTLKKLDFSQVTATYVKSRLQFPQILEILEHAQWRAHPKQLDWAKNPFRREPVVRWVLKINPDAEMKTDEAQAKPASDQQKEKTETPARLDETFVTLDDLVRQGGVSALDHALYLLPEVSGENKERYLQDLRLIAHLKSPAAKHARILFLTHQSPKDNEMIEELENEINETQSIKTLAEKNLHLALLNAWVHVLSHDSEDHVQSLEPVGQYMVSENLTDEQRGELMILLGEFLPPVMIPGLQSAFEPVDPHQKSNRFNNTVKHAAMISSLRYAAVHQRNQTGKLSELNSITYERPGASNNPGESLKDVVELYPSGIWQREWDDDPELRKLYAFFITLTRPEQYMDILKRQLLDHHTEVRDTVLMCLGQIDEKEAAALLHKYAKNPSENIRLASVAGLAGHGTAALRILRQDEAWRVRLAVAEELNFIPTLDSAILLKELVVDQSSQVQQQAIHQLTNWPDKLAIPLLFQAMINSQRQTRLAAAYQLQKRTGIVISQLDGSDQQRRDYLLKLASDHQFETNFWNQLLISPQLGDSNSTTSNSIAHKELLAQWLLQLWEQKKSQQGEIQNSSAAQVTDIELLRTDIPQLEKFLREHDEPSLKTIILHKLELHCSEFKSLDQLRDQDIQKRRLAARQLAEYSRQASLSPLLLEEVAVLMQQEQDEQVWRGIADSISKDTGEIQIRITRIMLNHRWADLQKLGCDFAAGHQLTQLAPDILRLFQSRDTNLLVKAVNTAGKLGNPVVIDHPSGGVRSLLNHPDPRVRKEASIALARLKDSQGIADLVRLAHSTNPDVRFESIQLIGELGDPSMVKHLHQLIWLEQDRRIKREIVKSLEQLTAETSWPYKKNDQHSDQEQAESWINYLNNPIEKMK